MDHSPHIPAVSVLLPVYNGEKYLREAIDSVLTQTYQDFKLVILNDGSTDNSAAIINSYSDPRIEVIHQPMNIGLTETLNRALDANLASTYIARMDQDDISLPYRLEKQVEYMEIHPIVGVLATNVRFVNEAGVLIPGQQYAPGLGGDYLRWRLNWENPIIHPTVMIRSQVLEKVEVRFDANYFAVDDYLFWLELSRKGIKIDLLSEICMHYRFVSTSISRKNRQVQLNHMFIFTQQEVTRKLRQNPPPVAIETLAAHFSEQTLAEYDYVGASKILTELALWHIHRASRRSDRSRIFFEAGSILDQFIQKSDTVARQRQIRIIKGLFFFYVRHISKFIRRLPIFQR